MNKEGIIYKILNLINSKVYIGQDSHNNPSYYGSGVQIINAIKKYGKDNFKKEILEVCDLALLGEREKYWISKYNSTDRSIGYNMTNGGIGGDTWTGRVHNEESKRKIACALTGIIRSEETKQKIRNARKNQDMSSRRGTPRSEETKRKISETKKLKKLWQQKENLELE